MGRGFRGGMLPCTEKMIAWLEGGCLRAEDVQVIHSLLDGEDDNEIVGLASSGNEDSSEDHEHDKCNTAQLGSSV
jgi:hypothetical protein